MWNIRRCLLKIIGLTKYGQATEIINCARNFRTSFGASHFGEYPANKATNRLNSLSYNFLFFLNAQNPALDISDEDHNEISGEFGDHSISVTPALGEIVTPPLPPEDEAKRPFKDNFKLFKPHHMKALIWKNFLWMWRNVGVMAFIIGLPCLQIILFCWAIGHDPTGLKLAVANHELNSTDECPLTEGCNYTLLSCRYLNILKKKNVVIVSTTGFSIEEYFK